jgi:hypothetical protein
LTFVSSDRHAKKKLVNQIWLNQELDLHNMASRQAVLDKNVLFFAAGAPVLGA